MIAYYKCIGKADLKLAEKLLSINQNHNFFDLKYLRNDEFYLNLSYRILTDNGVFIHKSTSELL